MTLAEYARRLAARFDNPPRPQFLAVAEAVIGVSDPLKAWQCVLDQGLIQDAFVTDHRRRYAENTEGQLIFPKERPHEHLKPASIGAVLTVASDPHGFLEAESHAREFARRLEPWTAVCSDEVVWYFTQNPYKQHPYETAYLGLSFNSAVDTICSMLDHEKLQPEDTGKVEGLGALPVLIRETVAAWQGWEFATSRNLKIRGPQWPLDLSTWQWFSELKNPFEPLLNLWCTGYRLVCDFDAKDPAIRLYANPVAQSAVNEGKETRPSAAGQNVKN
jgi:hypothetical protein